MEKQPATNPRHMAANINNRDNRLLNANRRAWGLQARVAELEGQAAARAGGAGNGVVRQDRDVAYNYNTVLHRLQGVRAELSTSEPVIDNFIEVLEDRLMGVEGPDNPLNAVAGAYEPAAKRLKTLTGNGCHCPVDLVTLLTPDNVFIGKRCNHLMTEDSAVLQLANGNTRCPFRCGDFVDLCKGPHLSNTGKMKAFKVTKASSSLWLGKQGNDELQRVYGITFPDKKAPRGSDCGL